MYNIISRKNLVALLKCGYLHPKKFGIFMHIGPHISTQIASFLPKRYFSSALLPSPATRPKIGCRLLGVRCSSSCSLGRPIIQIMRILGSSLLTKDDILELFIQSKDEEPPMMDNSKMILYTIDIY